MDGSKLRLYPSKKKWLAVLAGSIVLSVISYQMATDEGLDYAVAGYVGVLLFGILGIPASLFMLLPGSAYLELDSEGFAIRNFFRIFRQSWNDIKEFGIFESAKGELGSQKFVGWNYADTYKSATAGLEKTLLFSKYVSDATRLPDAGVEAGLPDTYGKSPEELLEIMNSWKSRSVKS